MSETVTSSSTGREVPLQYAHTPDLPGLLQHVGASLWITTYQVGKLIVLRPRGERLSMLPRSFDRAMGLAVSSQQIAVGTRSHVWFLENDPSLLPAMNPDASHDGCFVPRRSHVTGDVRGHEIVWARDHETAGKMPTLWIVNTLFSCLCTLDQRHSFVPRWQPPFVDAIAPEDRCHLNGVAVRNGTPRYVTALGSTNTPDGWRPRKLDGGCVVDVETGTTICDGLCMPHSPRWHRNQLWLLNSGRGELLCVDPQNGQFDVVASFPGYPRGLALRGDLAFVGLSQVREAATFGGVPLAQQGNLVCGVWVVQLTTGNVVGQIEFTGAVAEIFDVQLLPRILDPIVIGVEKDMVHRVFSLPATLRPLHPVGEAHDSARQHSAPQHAPSPQTGCQYLGRCAANGNGEFPADVYYLRYRSCNEAEGWQAAKLFVPVGRPPTAGWPVSIWCHGLGDPATQLHRWPWSGQNWPATRGRLAGRWAHAGVATITPWMPGDGPSQPYGSYSPFSLVRNGKAILDAIGAASLLSESMQLDMQRMVLRTTCVASSLLIHLAAIADNHAELAGLRAYIADDFQPGIAHLQSYLGPLLNALPARQAAAVRAVWLRALWSLYDYEGFPLNELVSERAQTFLSEAIDTPAGPLKRIFAQQLVPAFTSALPDQIVARLESQPGQQPSGRDVVDWMFAPPMACFFKCHSLRSALLDAGYRRYFAAYDPFFAENITPFQAKVPLLVVGQTDRTAGDVPGLPGRRERFEHLTQPKIDTLRSWGWNVRVSPPAAARGPSIVDPVVRIWVFQQLADLW